MVRPNWQTIAEKLNRSLAPTVFLRSLLALIGLTLVAVTMLVFAIPSPEKISKVNVSDKVVSHLQIIADAPEATHEEHPPHAEQKTPEAHHDETAAPPVPEQLPEHLVEEIPEHTAETAATTADTTSDTPPDTDAPIRKDVEDAIAGLYETTSYGPLPIKRLTDGKTAFELYRPPFSRHAETTGLISLVMADYGLSDKISAKAITTLPAAISMAISPYARMMQPKVTGARAYGHEVWLQLPIQDSSFGINDPGPATLLSGIKKEQNIMRLKTTLGRATGYVGLTFLSAPDFSGSTDGIDFLFDFMSQRGLAFSSADTKDTLSSETVARIAVPFGKGNLWLNGNLAYQDITESLKTIESIAKKDGVAIAYFYPSPKIISTLAQWQKTLADKNIQLAPLSAAIEAKAKP